MRMVVFAVMLILSGCVPSPWQATPPQLLSAVVSAQTNGLALEFDKPVERVTVGGDVAKVPVVTGKRVTVALAPQLTPGKRYGWSAEVNDSGGNQTSVAGRFYGPNDHAASLRLNEIRVSGSGDHTDFVELRAERAGSLGGWTVDVYAGPDARQRLVLPDTAVARGELLVVRYRAGNSDTKGAREFGQREGKGLSATKGLIVLRPEPGAAPSDGLLYAKTAGDGAPLAQAAGWSGTDELNPESCTPTRTWNRNEDGHWFVSANGGATPGQPNSTTVWKPTPKKPPKSSARPNRRRSDRGWRSDRDPIARQERGAIRHVRPQTRPEPTRVQSERRPAERHRDPQERERRAPTPKRP